MDNTQYKRTLWENDKTPLNETNMNKLEHGIEYVEQETIRIEGRLNQTNDYLKEVDELKASKEELRIKVDDEHDKAILAHPFILNELANRATYQDLNTAVFDTINLIVGEAPDALNSIAELLQYIRTHEGEAGDMFVLLSTALGNHANDTDLHVTATKQLLWEAHHNNGSIHVNQDEKNAWHSHKDNEDIHVTPALKAGWDSKAAGFHLHNTANITGLDTFISQTNTKLSENKTAIETESTTRASADTVLAGALEQLTTSLQQGLQSTLESSQAYTRTKIEDLVGGAQGSLDTLRELAAALGDNPNFATDLLNEVSSRFFLDRAEWDAYKHSYEEHNHDNDYSDIMHNHDGVYSFVHDHPYSLSTHNHDAAYSKLNHNHDSVYALIHSHPYLSDSHDASNVTATLRTQWSAAYTHSQTAHNYAASGHNHDDRYSLLSHTHSSLYAPLNHNHDSVYSPIHTHPYLSDSHDAKNVTSTKISNWDAAYTHSQTAHNYAASGHNHDGVYAPTHTHPYLSDSHDAKNVTSALRTQWNTAYTHSQSAHNYSLTTHNHDGVYAKPADITAAINALVGSAPDTLNTLQEIADMIDSNKDGVADWVALMSGYALTNHNHDAAYSKLNHTHAYLPSTHDASNVTATLRGQWNDAYTHSQTAHNYSLTTHNHDSVYSPIHSHPYLSDNHDAKNVTATLRGQWNTAYTHSQTSHDYAASNHNHSSLYAALSHNHDTSYATLSHTHNAYAASTHNHDTVYSKLTHTHAAPTLPWADYTFDIADPYEPYITPTYKYGQGWMYDLDETIFWRTGIHQFCVGTPYPRDCVDGSELPNSLGGTATVYTHGCNQEGALSSQTITFTNSTDTWKRTNPGSLWFKVSGGARESNIIDVQGYDYYYDGSVEFELNGYKTPGYTYINAPISENWYINHTGIPLNFCAPYCDITVLTRENNDYNVGYSEKVEILDFSMEATKVTLYRYAMTDDCFFSSYLNEDFYCALNYFGAIHGHPTGGTIAGYLRRSDNVSIADTHNSPAGTGAAVAYNHVYNVAVNLNSTPYTYHGEWTFNQITTATNFPTDLTWTGAYIYVLLKTERGYYTSTIKQTLTHLSVQRNYVRYCYLGSWGSWIYIPDNVVNKSGDTMTGLLTVPTLKVTGDFTALNGNFSFSDTTNVGIELGRRDGTPGTPYIDFHTDGTSTTDFNARLIADGNNLRASLSGGFYENNSRVYSAAYPPPEATRTIAGTVKTTSPDGVGSTTIVTSSSTAKNLAVSFNMMGTASQDFNNYRTTGEWYFYLSSATNAPPFTTGSGSGYYLKVMTQYASTTDPTYCTQMCWRRASNEIWIRYSISATGWSAWERVGRYSLNYSLWNTVNTSSTSALSWGIDLSVGEYMVTYRGNNGANFVFTFDTGVLYDTVFNMDGSNSKIYRFGDDTNGTRIYITFQVVNISMLRIMTIQTASAAGILTFYRR